MLPPADLQSMKHLAVFLRQDRCYCGLTIFVTNTMSADWTHAHCIRSLFRFCALLFLRTLCLLSFVLR